MEVKCPVSGCEDSEKEWYERLWKKKEVKLDGS